MERIYWKPSKEDTMKQLEKQRTVIAPKPDLIISTMEDTDSYKYSHYLLYPDEMTSMMSYIEARGGEFNECTLFSMQYHMHKYLSKPITEADVFKEELYATAHGEPFNKDGWLRIVREHNGIPPVRIRAIPEGLVVPIKNAIMTIEYRKKDAWIVNWLETALSRVWGPSTVAMISREQKKVIKHYLDLSSDNPDAELPFKLVDFGSRGVSCREEAQLAGAAHLLNFMASDTTVGIKTANYYYDCAMAGFSIPATEHSTMTIFGRSGEYEALKRWVQKTLIERKVPAGLPKLSACVGDSYDIYNFIRMVCSEEISSMIKSSGGTLIVRPDSGDPIEVLGNSYDLFGELIKKETFPNKKDYKMLPSWVQLIQGDGINRHSLKNILHHIVVGKGWSSSTIGFGSGGGLLRACDRDTQKWAFKCCAATIDGIDRDVRKDPITDPGKQSKGGRLDLIKNKDGQYETVVLLPGQDHHPDTVMNTVFDNGDILYHTTLDECRARMAI